MSQTIEVTAPDGNILEIDAPDGATPVQIHQAAIAAANHYKGQPASSAPAPTQTPLQQLGSDLANSNGVLGTANTLLKAPEKMSREGLSMIAKSVTPDQEVTGNLPRDIAMNIPRIGAETLAQVAPGFVSRGAILTAGALQGAKAASPLIKLGLKSLGSQAESMSGAVPGSLEAAYKAPLLSPLQLQPGKQAASDIYEAGKNIAGQVSPELAQEAGKLDFVKKAADLASQNKLNPTEALEARKELVAIKSRVTGEFFRNTMDKLNALAKPVFSQADEAYKEGRMADSLRQIMPQNKYGGASAFKTAIITGLEALKREGGTVGKVLGTAGQLSMSPAAIGAAATIAGDVAPVAKAITQNPAASAEGLQLIRRIATGALPKPILPNPVLAPAALTLTLDKAREFLKAANGNRDKARKMAQDKGYVIPDVGQ